MKKKQSATERFYRFLIKLFALCIVVLVLLIVGGSVWKNYRAGRVQNAGATIEPETTEDSTLVIYRPSPSSTTEAVENVLGTATPAPTPVPEETPNLLPIYDKGTTQKKEIAITVNDLSQAASLQRMAEAAENYNAKLTLFPSLNAMNDEFASMMIAKCVNNYGYEVENSGSFTDVLYKMDDEKMANSIWTSDNAIDGVVGGKYEVHFYRPFGALGVEDERTHAYLRQLGYKGIVTWSVNASLSSLETLMESIEPGQIYLFDSTTADTDKLITFLSFVDSKGYRVVTVNSLLGYDDFEVTEHDASFLFATMAPLEDYKETLHTLKYGERTYQVYRLQKRLIELGYAAEDSADGVFGQGTSAAVALFQIQNDMQGTGVCSVEIQQMLFADDAPQFTGFAGSLETPAPTEEAE